MRAVIFTCVAFWLGLISVDIILLGGIKHYTLYFYVYSVLIFCLYFAAFMAICFLLFMRIAEKEINEFEKAQLERRG